MVFVKKELGHLIADESLYVAVVRLHYLDIKSLNSISRKFLNIFRYFLRSHPQLKGPLLARNEPKLLAPFINALGNLEIRFALEQFQ